MTDLTFCREGNQSYRPSPSAPEKKLINFTKFQKLVRIVQGTSLVTCFALIKTYGVLAQCVDMQRFQVPYSFKTLPEVQDYLRFCLDKSKDHVDLEDLYRRRLVETHLPIFFVSARFNFDCLRSLLVEPKQPAEPAPSSELKQLFGWGNRNSSSSSQSSQATIIS